jgi:methionyl-tRNA formyltransferase
MLQIVFVGREIELLQELEKQTRVLAVYVRKRRVRRADIRHRLLGTAKRRQHARSFLNKTGYLPRKWFKMLDNYMIQDYARTNGLPILTATGIDDASVRSAMTALAPDLGVVANFKERLPAELLALPRYGFVNYHPSLLPKYRGANPLEHVLLNGDAESGVTWHRMVAALDSGDILAQAAFAVSATDTLRVLHRRSIDTAKQLLGPLLLAIERQNCLETPQNDAEATYCRPLSPEQNARLARLNARRRQMKTV